MSLRARLAALWARAQRWYGGYSPRDQRIILAVLVAVALSFLYVGPIDMLRTYRQDVDAEIAEGQERVDQARKIVDALDSLRRERDDLKRRLKQARTRLLPGGNATLGAAALQEKASDLAKANGVEVRTTQVMRDEAADPFRKVAVRVTVAGEIGAVAAMLAGLEYENQLTVPFMEISRRGAVVGTPGAPRTLTATIEVAGYVSGADGGGEGEEAEGEEELVGPPWPPATGKKGGAAQAAAAPEGVQATPEEPPKQGERTGEAAPKPGAGTKAERGETPAAKKPSPPAPGAKVGDTAPAAGAQKAAPGAKPPPPAPPETVAPLPPSPPAPPQPVAPPPPPAGKGDA